SSIRRFICTEFDTSPGQKSALPLNFSTSATVSLPFDSVGEVPATAAPSRAYITAMAWPSPEPNPVMTATVPLSFTLKNLPFVDKVLKWRGVDSTLSRCYFLLLFYGFAEVI